MVVSDGVLSLPGAMLGHNAYPGCPGGLVGLHVPSAGRARAGRSTLFVARSDGRTIPIDAEMGVEFPDLPRAGRLVQRLEAAGIDLASVTDVVLTHLHMDHVGGLLVDGGERPAGSGPAGLHVAAAEANYSVIRLFLPRLQFRGGV